MIGALLVAVAVAADPQLDAKLLGAEPKPAAGVAAAAGLDWSMIIPAVVTLAGLAIFLWFRYRGGPVMASGAIVRVAGQVSLGGQAGLSVVDVAAPDGVIHRLVVGTGPSGPSLLAEIGEAVAVDAISPDDRPPAPPPKSSSTRRERAESLLGEVLASRETA
jgi:hypothetical protein